MSTIAVVSTERLIRTQRAVSSSHQLIGQLNEYLMLAADAETGPRGYVITGQEGFLEPFTRSIRQRPRTTARLRALVAGDTAQESRLARVDSLLLLREAFLAENIRLRREGQTEEVVARIAGGGGKRLSDAIHADLTTMRAVEETKLAQLTQRAESRAEGALLLLGLVGVLGVLLVGTVTALLRRGLARASEAQRALSEAHETLSLIIEASPAPIACVDANRNVVVWNPSAERLFGLSKGEILGGPIPIFAGLPPAEREYLFNRVRQGELLRGVEIEGLTQEGEPLQLAFTGAALKNDDGELRGAMAIFEDIRDRKRWEAQLSKHAEELRTLSLTDELTGLHNRRGFLNLAEHDIRLARRLRRPFFVLYADLDGLKQINDSLGHAAGDRALRQCAVALREVVRETDVVGRLGGDEFAVFGMMQDASDPERLRAGIMARLEEFNRDAATGYTLAMSSGIILVEPEDDVSLSDLIASADAEMYGMKRRENRVRHE